MLKRFAALALLAATALPGMAADLPTHPFIHVNASSELRMMPDTGEIDIDIVSLDPDPDASWKVVTERLDAARALFAQHGVAVDDVFVQDIVRRARKVDKLAEGEPVPMETRVAVHATVRNLGPWTDMLRSLLAMKDIESLAVAFSRSDREQIEADLVTQALVAAKAKAQNIARGIGARLGPVTGVALTPLKNLSNAMGMATEPSTRYTGGRTVDVPDKALVQAMRLAQSADVIYRIVR
ncbi:SIMPL domain-containing protein [Massilia yuzhufengensis]|uniref:Uncharacterized conserved protein YggE, contains kinase-interacting SIMPL domain n=1 Tax=Massilia yuzhufengensis TaxID=1164594 RepID=A0A1I1ID89_9BURK|nr:SIMPL domain-containing protein [Massilia yuzhufengensis]SFC31210.1 Uncharacterized conserved protein YggE, contains kinase-interacting SIMPL domain [Massilia yuzhufengensis]